MHKKVEQFIKNKKVKELYISCNSAARKLEMLLF